MAAGDKKPNESTEVTFDAFDGGIREGANLAPSDFTERQWSILNGFVLEDESSIRSQWALQPVGAGGPGGPVTMQNLTTLVARSGSYLVGLDDYGQLWWTVAPADTADFYATSSVAWTRLTDFSGELAPADPDYRFLCTQPYTRDNDAQKVALRVHATAGDSPCVLIYENAAGTGLAFDTISDYWPESQDANRGEWATDTLYYVGDWVYRDTEVVVGAPDTEIPRQWYMCRQQHTSAGAGMSEKRWRKVSEPLNPNAVPRPGKAPRANVAAVWGDVMVLADIWFWKGDYPTAGQSAALTAADAKRFRNGMWFSVGGQPDTFLPYYALTSAIGADVTIVGLEVIDAGMLVFTTAASGRDGVVLLRGTPDAFTPELLRSGMGAARRAPGALGHRPFQTQWGASGSVVWVDQAGGVWATNGSDVLQLDRTGPLKPSAAAATDHVEAVGSYLFVSRDRRLLCMRLFEETGSWTSLALPPGVVVRQMVSLGASLYFTTEGGGVWRFALEGPPVSERGMAGPAALTLMVATPPLDGGVPHQTKLWTKYGLRASGLPGRVTPKVMTLTQSTAAFQLFGGSGVTTTLDRVLDRRGHVVLRGIGPSVECSVAATFTGDVRLESVTLWCFPAREAR